MPAFTFEKISPPVRLGPATSAPKKPRGVISQMIGRLAEIRTRGGLRPARDPVRRDEKPAK